MIKSICCACMRIWVLVRHPWRSRERWCPCVVLALRRIPETHWPTSQTHHSVSSRFSEKLLQTISQRAVEEHILCHSLVYLCVCTLVHECAHSYPLAVSDTRTCVWKGEAGLLWSSWGLTQNLHRAPSCWPWKFQSDRLEQTLQHLGPRKSSTPSDSSSG